MSAWREDWLKLTTEDPIEPQLPICDPHHHLWDGPGARGRYLLDEFVADAGCMNVTKSVFFECGMAYRSSGADEMKPVGEIEFVQKITDRKATGKFGEIDVAAGIVGFADLMLGTQLEPVLEALITAGKNRLRGIRQSTTWDPDPAIPSLGKMQGMLREPKFREGFGYLKKFGLSYDAWQYYNQLSDLADVAHLFPDINIIINHTGGFLGINYYADIRNEVFQEWKQGIDAVAQYPNVFMKLGGLGMPRCGFGWHQRATPPDSDVLAKAFEPYFSYCLEKFGVKRCMFQSNFPVDKESYSYVSVWNAFKKFTRGFGAGERAALLHDNATRIYRLN